MHSELRRMGEAVKAINKKFLMGGRVRDRTRTRVVHEGARDRAFIGEEDGKVGRNEKESGGGVKVRGYEGRKGSRSGDEGGA